MAKKEDKQNPMVTVIESGLWGIHEVSDVLARAFRYLIYDSNIKYTQWVTLLQKYLSRVQKEYTVKALTSMKGNIQRQLSGKSLTWKSFLKGLIILEYESMEIDITLHRKGKVKQIRLIVDDIQSELSRTLDDSDIEE